MARVECVLTDLREWVDSSASADYGTETTEEAVSSEQRTYETPSSSQGEEESPDDAHEKTQRIPVELLIEKARSERQRSIISLLAQSSPDRWWKARQLAEALGETNVASFRGTLDNMVKSGLLERNDEVCFRAARISAATGIITSGRRQDPFPGSSAGDHAADPASADADDRCGRLTASGGQAISPVLVAAAVDA